MFSPIVDDLSMSPRDAVIAVAGMFASVGLLIGVLALLAFACGPGTQEKAASTSLQTPATEPIPAAPTHDGRLRVLRETQCFDLLDVYPARPNRSHIITHTYTTEDVARCIAQDCTLPSNDCGTWTADNWHTFIPWMLANCADAREGTIHDRCLDNANETARHLHTLLSNETEPAR